MKAGVMDRGKINAIVAGMLTMHPHLNSHRSSRRSSSSNNSNSSSWRRWSTFHRRVLRLRAVMAAGKCEL